MYIFRCNILKIIFTLLRCVFFGGVWLFCYLINIYGFECGIIICILRMTNICWLVLFLAEETYVYKWYIVLFQDWQK